MGVLARRPGAEQYDHWHAYRPDGTRYTANKPSKAGAAAFYLKATALGRYMLYDQEGQLARVVGFSDVTRGAAADRFAEWSIARVHGGECRASAAPTRPRYRRRRPCERWVGVGDS